MIFRKKTGLTDFLYLPIPLVLVDNLLGSIFMNVSVLVFSWSSFLLFYFFRERNGLAVLATDTKQRGKPLDLLGI